MVSTAGRPEVSAKGHFIFPSVGSLVPMELDTLGYNPEQEPVDRWGGYPGYHWLQTLEGEGEVRVGPQRLRLRPRQGLLLPPQIPHTYDPISGVWSTCYLTFRGSMADPLVSAMGRPTSLRMTWADDSPLETFLARHTELVRDGEVGTVWSRSALVYQFLTLLRDHAEPLEDTVLSPELHDRLRPLFEFVETHLDDPGLGVEAMASFLGLSPRQLNELFAKLGSLPPYQYLKERRLIKARQLLLWYRELGVKEVSYRVGFRDSSHFIQTFRRAVGKSPDQFRRSYSAEK